MIQRFISLPRRHKQAISVATDFVLLLLAFWSVLALRFETWNPVLAPYAWQMLAAPLLAAGIYGAGRSGTQLLYALRAGRDYLPVAFFDDNPAIQQTELAGLRVHSPDALPAVLASKEVDEVLLAMPSANRARRVEINNRLEALHCKVKLIPSMLELVSGNLTADAIREVEIEDLLGRNTVDPDSGLLGQCITGKVVLMSGMSGVIFRVAARPAMC